MTDPDLTAICVVLDRSGSMCFIQDDAEGALNAFIEEQKAEPGRALLTLAQFDDTHELVFDNVPLDTVGHVPLVPRGNTALLDAMGKTLTALGERLAAMPEPERPGKVIVAVVTDGRENSSTEWSRQHVLDLVTQQREVYGWEVIYLSADENAIADAQWIGIPRDRVHVFASTGQGVRAAYGAVSASVSSYRQTGNATVDPGEQ